MKMVKEENKVIVDCGFTDEIEHSSCHEAKDHVHRMVKEQVQQYLTKPNHCI